MEKEVLFAFAPRNGLALHEKENMWRLEGLIWPGGPWESGVALSAPPSRVPGRATPFLRWCGRWLCSTSPRQPRSSTYAGWTPPSVRYSPRPSSRPRGYAPHRQQVTRFAPLQANGA